MKWQMMQVPGRQCSINYPQMLAVDYVPRIKINNLYDDESFCRVIQRKDVIRSVLYSNLCFDITSVFTRYRLFATEHNRKGFCQNSIVLLIIVPSRSSYHGKVFVAKDAHPYLYKHTCNFIDGMEDQTITPHDDDTRQWSIGNSKQCLFQLNIRGVFVQKTNNRNKNVHEVSNCTYRQAILAEWHHSNVMYNTLWEGETKSTSYNHYAMSMPQTKDSLSIPMTKPSGRDIRFDGFFRRLMRWRFVIVIVFRVRVYGCDRRTSCILLACYTISIFIFVIIALANQCDDDMMWWYPYNVLS